MSDVKKPNYTKVTQGEDIQIDGITYKFTASSVEHMNASLDIHAVTGRFAPRLTVQMYNPLTKQNDNIPMSKVGEVLLQRPH
ncbi:MAG: hypothetical protein ACOZAO_05955 [Patescibacteria group bacterium]